MSFNINLTVTGKREAEMQKKKKWIMDWLEDVALHEGMWDAGAAPDITAEETKDQLLAQTNEENIRCEKDLEEGPVATHFEEVHAYEDGGVVTPKQEDCSEQDYMEYSRHGSVIKGNENVVVRSIYEDDTTVNDMVLLRDLVEFLDRKHSHDNRYETVAPTKEDVAAPEEE